MRVKGQIILPEKQQKLAVASIRRYFLGELNVEIGDLKSTLVLDYILREIGPAIYNEAIGDARAFVDERAADLSAMCYHKEFPYWMPPVRRPS
jgi:uncharacterized protein (DUF2164 family)